MLNVKHIILSLTIALSAMFTAHTAQAAQSHAPNRAVIAAAPHAHAAQYQRRARPQAQQRAQAKISYAQAKSIARSKVPGSQVVDISLNGQTYRVRLQTRDGRVVDVYVDAATGRVR